jgi:hypothetical protein
VEPNPLREVVDVRVEVRLPAGTVLVEVERPKIGEYQLDRDEVVERDW